MTPKETAIRILKSAVAGCDDNIYRAKRSFQGLSPDQMKQGHGQSGRSRQEILDGYLEDQREKQAAVDWAISA